MICFGPNQTSGTNFLVALNLKNRSFINIVKNGSFDQE